MPVSTNLASLDTKTALNQCMIYTRRLKVTGDLVARLSWGVPSCPVYAQHRGSFLAEAQSLQL